jgi:hypothetical protein
VAVAVATEPWDVIEAAVSLLSAALVVGADVSGDRTGYDPTTGAYVVGADSIIATSTAVAGGLTPEPLTDVVINVEVVVYDWLRFGGVISDFEIGLIPGDKIYAGFPGQVP